MIQIDNSLTFNSFEVDFENFWELSGQKILSLDQRYQPENGTPVFTINGKYTSRGWTEWTQGFMFGSALLQFEATDDELFLEIGRTRTLNHMAGHISHIGVHDHGFNNVSTYGNLLRMSNNGVFEAKPWEKHFYELALKLSGAVQAARWSEHQNGGYMYSFNGPHSLFVDTIRTCRALIWSYQLGHNLQAENDKKINLLHRAVEHLISTAQYSVYYGEGRDSYDIWGRTAHESIFNTNDGAYRCPNTQQGYSGFTTWTRGLAWAMCGFAEQLEYLTGVPEQLFDLNNPKEKVIEICIKAAKATCDFYIEHTPVCGIPYWDTGAPNLYKIEKYLEKPANPYNEHEPVDSSAAAIGAQGLLRLGNFLKETKYIQAGLTTTKSLLSNTYLSNNENHEGLLLHSIYHQPNGWDYVHTGQNIANGEACQWGDYHLRELMLYIQKIAKNENYYTFYK